MAVVGYARVSTIGQNLEVQLSTLDKCDVIFQEKQSGACKEREELNRMLELSLIHI